MLAGSARRGANPPKLTVNVNFDPVSLKSSDKATKDAIIELAQFLAVEPHELADELGYEISVHSAQYVPKPMPTETVWK